MRDGSAVIPALRTLEDEQDCAFRMVQSGEGALSAAKKCRPDILVIDAVLPLMDGLGTIDRLREIYGERMPQVIGGVMMPFARDAGESVYRFKISGSAASSTTFTATIMAYSILSSLRV